ncbi:MAG: hypothetical protein P8X60_07440 [Robiginitalea sp.]|jgi:hypothetical protein
MIRILLFGAVFFLYLNPMSGQLTNRNFSEEDDRRDWSFSVTPYALLASQSTNVGGSRLTQSFGELSSITDAGFQLIASLRYKRFGLSLDGTWADLGTEAEQGPLLLDVKVKQKILDFKASYVIYETFEMKDNRIIDGWSLEALAGAKYWSNELNIDYQVIILDTPVAEGSINEPQDWWDLMLGVRTTISLAPKVLLSSWINFGGFGIGNSSKFAYDFTYLNAFRVSRLITINAGFRNFRYRRLDGEGDSELETRVNVLGPFLGVSFILN